MSFLVKEGNTLFVTLPGEIDHHQVHTLAGQIDEAILEGEPEELVFDFSYTRFMDSSGIGLLIGRYRKLDAMGGKVFLRNVNGQMVRILQLSGIEKLIGKYEERT